MKTYKVLVAEDDSALLKSIRLRLTAEGYEVLCAQDGYQAVAIAREASPDVLVLDINMPAGDGFSVQDRVWRMVSMRRTPIVYITGDGSQHLLERAHKLGARSLLKKPFSSSELVEAIRDALNDSECREDSLMAG
jgi:DNA-binding response OmpR family regulator